VLEYDAQHYVSPSPSDYGSFRTPETSVNYVSSSHWAGILDGITDLRNHLTRDEEAHPVVLDPTWQPASFPKPNLLYSCAMHQTSASILKSLPPRPTVDRLISRYFNIIDIAPGMLSSAQPPLLLNNTLTMIQTDYWESGIVHSGKFLREVRTIRTTHPYSTWPLPRVDLVPLRKP
jgi:hypothetical protein